MSGFFALAANVAPAGAVAHVPGDFLKDYSGTLTATNWNELLGYSTGTMSVYSGNNPLGNFVNTWLPAVMVGPLGINIAPSATQLLIKSSGGNILGLINSLGTEVLSVLDSGNVGIGTTAPAAALEINSASGYAILAGSSTSTAARIGNVSAPVVDFDAATKAYVDAYVATATSTMPTLWDGSLASNIWSMNMGNVGIGTTNPLYKLNIQGSGGTSGFVTFNNSVNSSPYVGLGYDQTADGLSFMYNDGSVGACGSYSVTGVGGLTYGTVLGADGKCWLDRNLGATRVATAYNDTQAYGYMYQWGRENDGHQVISPLSGTTATLSSTDSPGHGDFIYNSTFPSDWRNPQNDNLWQGLSGVNNPCPTGFRLPTQAEWQTLSVAIPNFTTATCGASSTCREVAFNSSLKLATTGFRDRTSGTLTSQGSSGSYWASDLSSTRAVYWNFTSTTASISNTVRANAFPVRCIKDDSYTPPSNLNKTGIFMNRSGNVGVGTTAPNSTLDIIGGSASYLLKLYNGVTPAFIISNGGRFYMYGAMSNGNSTNLFDISGNASSPTITHSSADAYASLVVNQSNASATGDILQLKNSASTVLAVKQSGNVGIGTTAPNAKLEINPTSGYAILAGSSTSTAYRIGNVAAPIADFDAATKAYVDAYVYTATSTLPSGISNYVGYTPTAYTGSNNGSKGYLVANGLCSAAFAGSHVCTSFEIMMSIVSGITMPAENISIFVGPPAYTASANDCEGRTSVAASSYGAYWEKPSTNYPQGRGLLGACSAAAKLACCL